MMQLKLLHHQEVGKLIIASSNHRIGNRGVVIAFFLLLHYKLYSGSKFAEKERDFYVSKFLHYIN